MAKCKCIVGSTRHEGRLLSLSLLFKTMPHSPLKLFTSSSLNIKQSHFFLVRENAKPTPPRRIGQTAVSLCGKMPIHANFPTFFCFLNICRWTCFHLFWDKLLTAPNTAPKAPSSDLNVKSTTQSVLCLLHNGYSLVFICCVWHTKKELRANFYGRKES